MPRTSVYLVGFALLASVSSCTTFPSLSSAPSATASGPRTLVLNGKKVSEEDSGGFTSWYCTDYVDGGRVLVEVGFSGDPIMEGMGFVLYDGGYSGEYAFYHRAGLDHRWDWGPNLGEYAFVIKSDGTGLYYNFSSVPYGEATKASSVYKCHKR